MPTKPTNEKGTSQPAQDAIAERARQLWQQRGSPGGRDLEHWLDAERQLRDEQSRRGDVDEAEKRLDGLIEQKPNPASRTPRGEQL